MQLHFTLPRPYSNHLSGEPYIWRLLQLANNFSWSEILMKNYIESWNYYFKGVILKNLFFLLFVLFILVHLISTGSESDCCTNSCCFLKKSVTLMLVKPDDDSINMLGQNQYATNKNCLQHKLCYIMFVTNIKQTEYLFIMFARNDFCRAITSSGADRSSGQTWNNLIETMEMFSKIKLYRTK